MQIGIEPFGKVLVAAGIANKAGVILDGMGDQGAHVGDEVLWYTGFTQKYFGNIPLRAIDGINANARWASMFYCLQSSHSAQIDINEVCPPDCNTAEVGMVEVSAGEVGMAEAGVAKVGMAEAGVTEVCIVEICIVEICIAEIGSYLGMLLSPCIPNDLPLLEQVKMLLDCQVVNLLCSALIIERCGYDCKHCSFCLSSGDFAC